jgi:hypothetical protein
LFAHRAPFDCWHNQTDAPIAFERMQGKPGECFLDVAARQLSFETFCVEFFGGKFFVDRLNVCSSALEVSFSAYKLSSSAKAEDPVRLALSMHHRCLGILGRPLSRAMTAACVATANLCLSAWIYLRAFLRRRTYHPLCQRNGFAVGAGGCREAALDQEAYVRSSAVCRQSSFT